jgi:hypothetical protein
MRYLVPTVEGMLIANPSYVSTIRTTLCDIMCTTNTCRLTSEPKIPSGSQSFLATMPYEKVTTFKAPNRAMNRFQKLKSESINKGKMDELRKDRDEFYKKFHQEREEVMSSRSRAAVMIQAVFRGFKTRPKNLSYIPKRKKISVKTQNDIHDELCELALKMSLKPIPGLSLEPRIKASKRRIRIENAAAYRLQRFFRMIVNRKLALVVVKTKIMERMNNSSRIITRAVRFVITKKFVKRVETIKRERSAVIIQAYLRKFLAKKR